MDSEWKNNKKRFLKKIDIMDSNFCTTDPNISSLTSLNSVTSMIVGDIKYPLLIFFLSNNIL